MLFELIPVALAIGAVLVALYTDLKERIIPNRLTYPLIVAGIAFHLGLGVYSGNFFRALYGIFGASLAFVIGYVMYLTGGWAGGDVKLFTGLGALLPAFEAPFSLPYPTTYAPYAINLPLFPLTLLINSVIAMVPFMLVYVVISRMMGRGAFYDTSKISELEEGTIPAEIIYEKDGEVSRYRSGRFGFLSRNIGTPDWDERYTNPDRAAGITEENLQKLKSLVREGRIEDEIKVKRGMPFAPALAAGVFIGIFYGSLYWTLIKMLI